MGPLIETSVANGEAEVFLPAPAHWLGVENMAKGVMTIRPGSSGLDAVAELGLEGSSTIPLLVDHPPETSLKSLHGLWANRAAFEAVAEGVPQVPIREDLAHVAAGEAVLVQPAALFSREQRVGIALDLAPRRVRKGHLYVATHVRLAPGVLLLVGLSEEIVPSHLDPAGLLHLGGEQRLVRYRVRKENVVLPGTSTGWHLALAPVEFASAKEADLLNRPRASGPLLRMAGWNMKEQFHKPVKAYLPSGTVIKSQDDSDAFPFGFVVI